MLSWNHSHTGRKLSSLTNAAPLPNRRNHCGGCHRPESRDLHQSSAAPASGATKSVDHLGSHDPGRSDCSGQIVREPLSSAMLKPGRTCRRRTHGGPGFKILELNWATVSSWCGKCSHRGELGGVVPSGAKTRSRVLLFRPCESRVQSENGDRIATGQMEGSGLVVRQVDLGFCRFPGARWSREC